MVETATTILTAIAMLGHSILGCHWHHDHGAHSEEHLATHSASHADADHEDLEEISQSLGSVTECEVPVGGDSDEEGECTYLKPKRTVVFRPVDEVSSSAANVVNVAGRDRSSISSTDRQRHTTLLFAPPVRALTSVSLL